MLHLGLRAACVGLLSLWVWVAGGLSSCLELSNVAPFLDSVLNREVLPGAFNAAPCWTLYETGLSHYLDCVKPWPKGLEQSLQSFVYILFGVQVGYSLSKVSPCWFVGTS